MEDYKEAVKKFVEFWKKLDVESTSGYIHPDDKSFIDLKQLLFYKNFDDYYLSDNYGKESQKDLIHTGLIPSPYCGDLLNAKIFLLFLNPGFEESNYINESCNDIKEALLETLKQDFVKNREFPYFTLNPKFSASDGAKWIRKKLENVVQSVVKEEKKDYKQVLKDLSQNIASIELFPYHSAIFSYKAYCKNMPSVKAAKEFCEHLVKRAQTGEITLIVTRARKEWNIVSSENVVVYTGGECRKASLSETSEGGKAIIEVLKNI